MAEQHPTMREPQRVGLLLVHGIGDQGRFEHLHNVADSVIKVLVAMHGEDSVNVIMPGVQGAPLSIKIRGKDEITDQLDLHEMWWRDLGQPQTLGAIVRFWWWAASLAGTSGYFVDSPNGYDSPNNSSTRIKKVGLLQRIMLFFQITYCFVLLAPINLVITFSHFLPGVKRIQFIHSVFTHFSSVQMYQEKASSQRGTLVDYDRSRRVSIQRRLAEHFITMAEFNYDRWYIAGHGLGSVIAFKGLMYSDHAFAKFVNYNRWCHEKFARFRGRIDRQCDALADEPRLPTWLSYVDVVDTKVIFKKLHGIITYGSPLEMFATIWPGIVPIKRGICVRNAFEWINI